MSRRSQTRRSLEEAAFRLFRDRGYDATTVADIAAAVGVTERTFFHHFGCKADAAYPNASEHREELRGAIRRRGSSRPPLEALVDAVAAFAATIEPQRPEILARAQLAAADQALEWEVVAAVRRWERELADEFASLAGHDEPQPGDRVLSALALSLVVEVTNAANEDEPLERTARRVGGELVQVLRS